MKTIIAKNGLKLQVYNSIDELPIINFQKFNKFLLIDSGVGSDADAIDGHILNLAKLIAKDDKDKAAVELQNMRQAFQLIIEGVSPQHKAFAALIYSINGEVQKDLSDEGLDAVIERIREVRHSAVIEWLFEIKKKVYAELEVYFPEDFSDAREKEYYDRIKAKTLLLLDQVIKDKDNTESIKQIDDKLFSFYTPRGFIGSSSAEVLHDKQFEAACTLIGQKANLDARKMNTLQFYSTLNVIKQQAEAEAKAYKKQNSHGRR